VVNADIELIEEDLIPATGEVELVAESAELAFPPRIRLILPLNPATDR
jgi:hypothetical protein